MKYFQGNLSDENSSIVPRLFVFKFSSRLVAECHHFTVDMANWNHKLYAILTKMKYLKMLRPLLP